MPNFTPRPDRSLVRVLRTTDEQLASVLNQAWQAIADNLQLATNNLGQLEQQATAIAATLTSIENSFNSQQSQLQSAQNSASPVLATSLQRNSDANTLVTANSAAVAKTTAANTALTAAETNLNAIATFAQPFNSLLQSISGMARPNNSMLGTNAGGATTWILASGQSFTIEFGYFAQRVSSATNGGALGSGSGQQILIASALFSNARNQWGIIETSLDGNTLVLPCTGGNCRYYFFGLATFSGVGSINSRFVADGASLGGGLSIQSVPGRAAVAENFNQVSVSFAALNVTGQALVSLQGWIQTPNTLIPSAGLGIGLNTGSQADLASVLFFRRRFT